MGLIIEIDWNSLHPRSKQTGLVARFACCSPMQPVYSAEPNKKSPAYAGLVKSFTNGPVQSGSAALIPVRKIIPAGWNMGKFGDVTCPRNSIGEYY
ncbi:MAG: hypothetical protein KAU17_12545 [Spirochaetales bacterium]|nr:hypothetical protein [Spirochaetales bacterium]